MPDDDPLVDELAAEICAYLQAYPHAADTLDGVVQWWIAHQRFLRGIAATARALERLVVQGRVEQVRTGDGRIVFRAARPGPGKKSDVQS